MLPLNKRLAQKWCGREPVRFHRSEEWFWVQYSLKMWGLPRDLCRMIARSTDLHSFYFDRESETLRNERIFMQLKFRSGRFSQQTMERLLSCVRFATHQLRKSEHMAEFYPCASAMVHAKHYRTTKDGEFGVCCAHPYLWGRMYVGGPFGGFLKRRRIIRTRHENTKCKCEKCFP